MSKLRIPDGFREDAQGRLVPIETIKQIDLDRDVLVENLFSTAVAHNQGLAAYKENTLASIQEFVDLSAKRFNAKVGGKKGNITLLSFDGRKKIVVASSANIAFDERLQIAQGLIQKCIKRWSDGSRPEILALVNDAFQVDNEGQVSVGRILGLKRLDIEDRDWKKAMDAIAESMRVVSSKTYIRVYERDDESGEYKPVSLDLASV